MLNTYIFNFRGQWREFGGQSNISLTSIHVQLSLSIEFLVCAADAQT